MVVVVLSWEVESLVWRWVDDGLSLLSLLSIMIGRTAILLISR